MRKLCSFLLCLVMIASQTIGVCESSYNMIQKGIVDGKTVRMDIDFTAGELFDTEEYKGVPIKELLNAISAWAELAVKPDEFCFSGALRIDGKDVLDLSVVLNGSKEYIATNLLGKAVSIANEDYARMLELADTQDIKDEMMKSLTKAKELLRSGLFEQLKQGGNYQRAVSHLREKILNMGETQKCDISSEQHDRAISKTVVKTNLKEIYEAALKVGVTKPSKGYDASVEKIFADTDAEIVVLENEDNEPVSCNIRTNIDNRSINADANMRTKEDGSKIIDITAKCDDQEIVKAMLIVENDMITTGTFELAAMKMGNDANYTDELIQAPENQLFIAANYSANAKTDEELAHKEEILRIIFGEEKEDIMIVASTDESMSEINSKIKFSLYYNDIKIADVNVTLKEAEANETTLRDEEIVHISKMSDDEINEWGADVMTTMEKTINEIVQSLPSSVLEFFNGNMSAIQVVPQQIK